jgi:hypothetical protein
MLSFQNITNTVAACLFTNISFYIYYGIYKNEARCKWEKHCSRIFDVIKGVTAAYRPQGSEEYV